LTLHRVGDVVIMICLKMNLYVYYKKRVSDLDVRTMDS